MVALVDVSRPPDPVGPWWHTFSCSWMVQGSRVSGPFHIVGVLYLPILVLFVIVHPDFVFLDAPYVKSLLAPDIVRGPPWLLPWSWSGCG